MKKTVLSIVSLLLCAYTAVNTYNPQRKFPPSLLREDFFVFRTALEESHPGLYTFHSKSYMDSVFQDAFLQLDKEKTETEFVRVLAKVVSQIGCGHTAVTVSDDFWDFFLLKDSVLFPLQIKFIDKKMYVREDLTMTNGFPLGTEIVSVNGKPVDELVKVMFPMIPADGLIETSKYIQLDVDFPFYYASLVETPKTFLLNYILPSGEKKTLSVKALPLPVLKKNFREILRKRNAPSEAKNLRLRIFSDSSIAVLTIHTFSKDVLNANHEKFKSFIDEAFERIEEKKIKDLVIDLRWNTGGEDTYAGFLYSYIADSLYRIYRDNFITTQKRFSYPEFLDKPYRYNMFKWKAVKNAAGQQELKFLKMHSWQRPRKEFHFYGNVYVLMNGGTFSAASSFCSMASNYRRALFFGEETGGEYYGCNGNKYPVVTLPNTYLKLRFALVKNIYDVKGYPVRGRGVMPDFPVSRTLEDFKNNKDTELKYVIDHILKRKK